MRSNDDFRSGDASPRDALTRSSPDDGASDEGWSERDRSKDLDWDDEDDDAHEAPAAGAKSEAKRDDLGVFDDLVAKRSVPPPSVEPVRSSLGARPAPSARPAPPPPPSLPPPPPAAFALPPVAPSVEDDEEDVDQDLDPEDAEDVTDSNAEPASFTSPRAIPPAPLPAAPLPPAPLPPAPLPPPPSGGVPSGPTSSGQLPSGPLPPPPRPPDFGSLAPKLGATDQRDSDWGEDEDSTGVFGDKGERQMPDRDEAPARGPAGERVAGGRGGMLVAFGIAAIVIAGLAAFFLWPRQGTLLVNVTGPGGVAVPELRVLVDGREVCDSSPCRVPELTADSHILRVVAPGFHQPVDRYVRVPGGGIESVDVSLTPSGSGSSSAAGGTGTGVQIPELGKYLRVKIDGKERGVVPLTVSDLEPGDHEIELAGNERYAPFKGKVVVEAGKVVEFRPKLEVVKGLVRITAGKDAAGARVTFECPGEGESLLEPPTSIDVTAKDGCQLQATREGFEPFRQLVKFDDGQAEKAITIELVARGAGDDRPPAGGKPKPGLDKPGTKPGVAAGQGRLSINSIPISNVVVDGRPVGSTPTSLSVAPGPHTVMFIHPEMGRKVVTVQVAAGQTATAAVRF